MNFTAIPDFDTRSEVEISAAKAHARRHNRRFVPRDYWDWVKISEIRIDRLN